MTEQEMIYAVARTIYWGYGKDTTGTPGNLSNLGEAEREIWMAAGKRALWRMEQLKKEQLRSQPPTNGTGIKPVNGMSAKPRAPSKPNGTLSPTRAKPAASALSR